LLFTAHGGGEFPGVTLDWLFLGRTEGLTVEMAHALAAIDGDSPSTSDDEKLW
jgi:hypothetical protein